jgi:hypothetical protein
MWISCSGGHVGVVDRARGRGDSAIAGVAGLTLQRYGAIVCLIVVAEVVTLAHARMRRCRDGTQGAHAWIVAREGTWKTNGVSEVIECRHMHEIHISSTRSAHYMDFVIRQASGCGVDGCDAAVSQCIFRSTAMFNGCGGSGGLGRAVEGQWRGQ